MCTQSEGGSTLGEMTSVGRRQDGHRLDAYVGQASQTEARGGVVVIQEIFGVNAHIRSIVGSDFAAAGYVAIAPALFDRVQRGVELSYAGEDMQRAVGYMKAA